MGAHASSSLMVSSSILSSSYEGHALSCSRCSIAETSCSYSFEGPSIQGSCESVYLYRAGALLASALPQGATLGCGAIG
jgi:hypothetical protein